MSLVDVIYLTVLSFIRTVKWVELQTFKLFSKWITQKALKLCEELGIVCHFNDESYITWSPSDEKGALAKAGKKYETLIHIMVHDKSVFLDIANTCNWGIGEGFVSKKWDLCDVSMGAELWRRLLENNFLDLYYNRWNRLWNYLEFEMFNLQTRSRAMEVAKKHYDLGNDLYQAMLDPYMQYSCGYWKDADNLDDAQLNKLELIARKLKLKPGMRVLDIGCGFGMLCKYLAERHGVECVGVTISTEQAEFGSKACKGLPVELRLQDYRDLDESFDRIVSVGMFEHVGSRNYGEFMEIAHRNLKDDGIFLLHTIGVNHVKVPRTDRWLCTRIFPNGCLPKLNEVADAAVQAHFIMEDWHNLGSDYAKTLAEWRGNFLLNWPALSSSYGEEFYRVWIYYLTMCEGFFLARKVQLWQLVLSKDGIKEEYRAAR